MNDALIEKIKSGEDKQENIKLLGQAISALRDEVTYLLATLMAEHQDFVLETMEIQIKTLTQDIKDIFDYLKNESKLDDQQLKIIESICREIEI
jgi:hypothetical protein